MGLVQFVLVFDAPHLCSAALLRDTRKLPAPAAALFDAVNIKSCVPRLKDCKDCRVSERGKDRQKITSSE